MAKLLDADNRKKLEDIMTKHFMVDAIRSEFGDPMNVQSHLSELQSVLPDLETRSRNRVLQMRDE
jgi:hypothetical protein